MKYVTFEHLSNTPQLSFLFVLKQKNQKGNLQGFGQIFSTVSFSSNTKISGGDSIVIARASMKPSTNLSTNYECETSPKHKIYIIKFKTKTRSSMNHT